MMSQWTLHNIFQAALAKKEKGQDLKTLLTANGVKERHANNIVRRVGNNPSAWKLTNAALKEVDGQRGKCAGKGFKDRSLTPREQQCLMNEGETLFLQTATQAPAPAKKQPLFEDSPAYASAKARVNYAIERDNRVRYTLCSKDKRSADKNLAERCAVYEYASNKAYEVCDTAAPESFQIENYPSLLDRMSTKFKDAQLQFDDPPYRPFFDVK